MENYTNHTVVRWKKDSNKKSSINLVGEEPLSIRIQGKPYSVVMRTPGDEIPHVAGFCLGEGVIDSMDDFTTIGFCDGLDSNVVTVTLNPARREKISEVLDRREFISQTSCGLCGKELVKDLYQQIQPIDKDIRIDIEKALTCLLELSNHQTLRQKTRASHAAVLYDPEFKQLSVAEDVGRHNALDKAIGKVFLDGRLEEAAMLVLSSRISYELVQKASRARIPVILAVSRPTALAVELASELNMTLASLNKPSGLHIYCGEQRLLQ